MKATHKASGVTVSGDEAVLRRLGPEWLVEAGVPKTPKRSSRRKAASKPDEK